MYQLLKPALLYSLLAILIMALATAFLDQPAQRPTWKYSQFIQEVQAGNVDKVSLSPDHTRALVTAQDGTRVIVNLPNDLQLSNLLARKNVDVSVLPQSDESSWLQALSSLFFPILLLMGIFLLLRLGLR